MNECCDTVVASKYDETAGDPRIMDLVGRPVGGAPVVFVKTHDLPEDDSPAISLVRDGLASIVSYLHFLADWGRPSTMERLIDGDDMFGSWSDHFQRLEPPKRAATH